MTDRGQPPRGLDQDEIEQFERACLEHVRLLLAPGAALRDEMEHTAHKRPLSIELDREHGPAAIVAEVQHADGQTWTERVLIWSPDPTPPNPRVPHEVREVALTIAVGIAEP
jgi:hypothetical protein